MPKREVPEVVRLRIVPIIVALVHFLATPNISMAEEVQSGHAVFDRVVELVTERFYDTSALQGFEEAVRKEVQDPDEPLEASSGEERVDAAIDRVLASLQASHTGRFKPDTIAYYELADIFRFALRDDMRRLFPPDGEVSYQGIGMAVEAIEGKLFVSDVYDGAPAQRAGVLVGDEILSVDGAPYHEIESFRDKAGKTVQLELVRHEGRSPMMLEVEVERLRPLQTFAKAMDESMRVLEQNGRRLGYVRLWTLSTREGMETVARSLAAGALKEAEGVIVDLRGRWGGGEAGAAELFIGNTVPFRLIFRDGREIYANVRWNRPVVALIDDGARSGLELFAYSLKQAGIPLIGSRTAGALLAGRAFLLPDDSLMILAVSDAVIGENVRLEGRGVQPDVPVRFRLPYAAGQDPQLDVAIQEMLRVLSTTE